MTVLHAKDKMNLQIFNAWPTPIVIIEYGDRFQAKIDEAIHRVNFMSTPEQWGKTHKISNGFDKDIIGDLQLDNLAKEIDSNVMKYCEMMSSMYTKYRRTSWFTKFDKDDYGHVHNHTHNTISGCYYYKTSGRDGSIFFNCPNQAMNAHIGYIPMSQPVTVEPKEGVMLLFPGWLEHGIQRNNTDESRISLSFNIEFDYFNAERNS